MDHCVCQQQCGSRWRATGPAMNRLPQAPTLVQDHPADSKPDGRSVENRRLETRIVGDQNSARLSRNSQSALNMGRQLVTRRPIEQLLPALEIDSRQHFSNRSALGLVEIKHNTATTNGSERKIRPTPATRETTLPRHFEDPREGDRSSRDQPQ